MNSCAAIEQEFMNKNYSVKCCKNFYNTYTGNLLIVSKHFFFLYSYIRANNESWNALIQGVKSIYRSVSSSALSLIPFMVCIFFSISYWIYLYFVCNFCIISLHGSVSGQVCHSHCLPTHKIRKKMMHARNPMQFYLIYN